MSRWSQKAIARAALKRHPKSHAERLGIDVAKDTPSPLYRWLLAALLYSTRISAELAESAARALSKEGWRTPAKMAASSWRQRVDVLNAAGYARYDESTAGYIGAATELLLARWDGDLRRLRDEADRDPAAERRLLKAFKGIGDVGCDIFFREAQVAWDEIHPFADRKALQAADALGLPDDPTRLARLLERKRDLPRLLSALIWIEQDDERKALLDEAA